VLIPSTATPSFSRFVPYGPFGMTSGVRAHKPERVGSEGIVSLAHPENSPHRERKPKETRRGHCGRWVSLMF